MQQVNFDEVLEKIVAVDKRYHRDAYIFVREALDHTQKIANRSKKTPANIAPRHVSGQELLGVSTSHRYALVSYRICNLQAYTTTSSLTGIRKIAELARNPLIEQRILI